MLPNVGLLSLLSLLTTSSLSSELNDRLIIRLYEQKRDKSSVVGCTDRASAIKQAIVCAFLIIFEVLERIPLMISDNWSILL